jgi:tetratricopeptide (TPR) repeat protein
LFGADLSSKDEAKFSIEEARALTSLGRTGEAARAAGRALALIDWISAGDRGRAYVALADVFVAAGELERAEMLYGQGLDLLIDHGKPFALDAGRRLADLLEQRGDETGALAVLKRAAAAASAPTQVKT